MRADSAAQHKFVRLLVIRPGRKIKDPTCARTELPRFLLNSSVDLFDC